MFWLIRLAPAGPSKSTPIKAWVGLSEAICQLPGDLRPHLVGHLAGSNGVRDDLKVTTVELGFVSSHGVLSHSSLKDVRPALDNVRLKTYYFHVSLNPANIPAMPLDLNKMEALRKERGFTQEQAARKAKLSGKSYWADIVSGRKSNITIEVLDNIAKALGVSPKELIK